MNKVFFFRVFLILVAISFFFFGVDFIDRKKYSAGMFYITIAVGALAYSNIIDPGKKTTLSDAASGKTRWPLTPVGQVLQLVYFLLIGITGWLWLKYG